MKKVTVNGVDHELSPDSPRSRSHVELLQDIVTSINELEDGETMSGIELASTAAADNVIRSASTDASASVAAMTFKNNVANALNELEFNFVDNADSSLLKIDNEGDTTVAGRLTSAGVTSSTATPLTLSGTTTNVITNNAEGATGSVAALTFKNSFANASDDFEFNFTDSSDASLMSIDNEGDVLIAGALGITGAATAASVSTPTITGAALSAKGTTADGGTAVGVTLGSNVTYANGAAKLVSFTNNTTEKSYIDYNGEFVRGGGFGVTVDRINATNAIGIELPNQKGIGGNGTGITTDRGATISNVVHRVTVTYAAFPGAATTASATLWTVPAKTRIVRVLGDVTTLFSGGGVGTATLQVGIGGGDTDAYIVASNVFTGATELQLGDRESHLGVALSNAGTGIGAYPSWSGTPAISALLTVDTTTGALTAGSVTFYIECATYPY